MNINEDVTCSNEYLTQRELFLKTIFLLYFTLDVRLSLSPGRRIPRLAFSVAALNISGGWEKGRTQEEKERSI